MDISNGLESRGKQLVRKHLLEPMLERCDNNIGVELEYPIICIDNRITLKAAADNFLNFMIQEHDCQVVKSTYDGQPVRIRTRDGDCLSFDFHYGQLEFSMWRGQSLQELAVRFFALYQMASGFYQQNGFVMTGMGTNPLGRMADVSLVPDAFAGYIGDFMEFHTSYHNKRVIFTNMYSNQTHLDIPGSQLLRCINLMLQLDFVGGLLFSNSLPNPETLPVGCQYPDDILCARDINWQYSEFPALNWPEQKFETIDQLAGFLSEQEMFLTSEVQTGHIIARDKISVRDYFAAAEHQDEDIRLFRMFSRIALNHYHTLEFRGDCIQPLADTFAPNAFYLGLISNLAEAEALTGQFYTQNNIMESSAQLRARAVVGQMIVEPAVMKTFLNQLLAIAKQGLYTRGLGEAQYLEPLSSRIATLCCPAQVMRERLAAGSSLYDLINEWGNCIEMELLYSADGDGGSYNSVIRLSAGRDQRADSRNGCATAGSTGYRGSGATAGAGD